MSLVNSFLNLFMVENALFGLDVVTGNIAHNFIRKNILLGKKSELHLFGICINIVEIRKNGNTSIDVL